MKIRLLLPLVLLSVAACALGPENFEDQKMNPNMLSLDFKDGQYIALAGANWTDEELRTSARGDLCAEKGLAENISIERNQHGVARVTYICVQ